MNASDSNVAPMEQKGTPPILFGTTSGADSNSTNISMSSWQYAYFFEGSDCPLNAGASIDVMADTNLAFDASVLQATVVDEHGHLEYVNEVPLTPRGTEELKRRLTNGEQFLVECRNTELFFACCFAPRYSTPHFSLGWSRRFFGRLSPHRKEVYRQMLYLLMTKTAAGYVVFVDDPPAYFEDNFVVVEQQCVIDPYLPSGRQYDIQFVWVDTTKCDAPEEGVDLSRGKRVGGPVVQYPFQLPR